MNRAQRRQAAFKRTQRDRNAQVEPSSVLRPILMCRQFDAEEARLGKDCVQLCVLLPMSGGVGQPERGQNRSNVRVLIAIRSHPPGELDELRRSIGADLHDPVERLELLDDVVLCVIAREAADLERVDGVARHRVKLLPVIRIVPNRRTIDDQPRAHGVGAIMQGLIPRCRRCSRKSVLCTLPCVFSRRA